MGQRLGRAVVQRLIFLAAANVLLLLLIRVLLREGGSFSSVILRAGPDVAPVVLAGLGMSAIVLTGAIDLSIASMVAVSGVVFGVLVHYGVAPWIADVACVATPVVLALTNFKLVRALGIAPIIVTLAGLPLYRGLALIGADVAIPHFGGNISVQNEAYHAPGRIYGGVILLAGILFALLWEAFGQTPRRWLACGSSEEACRLAGLDPGRILRGAFLANGCFLGLASLIYVSRVQAIEPARMALGFELQVIGAVVLGGTNIFGGEGSLLGTILGAFFLYLISQALVYAGASPYSQDAITGAVIVLVIAADCALHRRKKRMEELR